MMIQTRGGARAGEGRAHPGPALAAFPELATYEYRAPVDAPRRAPLPPAAPAARASAVAQRLRRAFVAAMAGAFAAGALALSGANLLP